MARSKAARPGDVSKARRESRERSELRVKKGESDDWICNDVFVDAVVCRSTPGWGRKNVSIGLLKLALPAMLEAYNSSLICSTAPDAAILARTRSHRPHGHCRHLLDCRITLFFGARTS